MPKSIKEILSNLDLFDPEQTDNMVEALAEARQSCPVIHSEADGGYYLVTRYDDVRSACERTDDFSNSEPALRGKPAGVRLIPLDADPPLHRDFRRLLNPFFTRSYLNRYEPKIREIARTLVDGLLKREEFDFVYDYAVPLTAGVLSNMIFVKETPDFMAKAVANVERVAAEFSVEAFTELGMMAAEALARAEARGDSADEDGDGTVLGVLNAGTIEADVRSRRTKSSASLPRCSPVGSTRPAAPWRTLPNTSPRGPTSSRASAIRSGSRQTSTSSCASSRRSASWHAPRSGTPSSGTNS